MDNHIVPECYIDTMLVQTLVPPEKHKKYNHQHGCFSVTKEMQSKGLKDKFAVGIIDNDKNKASYLKEFVEIDEVDSALKLYKHKEKAMHQYFIIVNPAMETFILDICRLEGIDIAQFGLPVDLDMFKRITKSQTSSHDKRFIDLFSSFKKSGNKSILKLIHWIELLKEKNYKVDINDLKNG